MLSPLRSTISRSLWLPTRSVSSQANAGENGGVMSHLFSSFTAGPESLSLSEGEAQPPERKPIPLNKIEVPLPQDPLLDFFSSQLMNDGKRARAERCASEILLHINALTRAPPMPILRQAVSLASPAVKVIEHKASSKSVVKPFALNERQRMKKAIEWILEESEKRPGYTRGERIARECVGIIQGSSGVLKSKENLHKAAMVSRGNLPRTQ